MSHLRHQLTIVTKRMLRDDNNLHLECSEKSDFQSYNIGQLNSTNSCKVAMLLSVPDGTQLSPCRLCISGWTST